MRRAVAISFALIPSACGIPFTGSSGDGRTVHVSRRVVTETRSVEGFSGIALSHVGRLVVERGSAETLTVTANEDVLPHLDLGVRGGLLRLGVRDGINLVGDVRLEYRVTARHLDELLVSGASNAEVRGIDAHRLTVDISGASSVVAEGHADRQQVTISGASRYVAEALPSQVTLVSMSGASTAFVRVAQLLEGSLSGASQVVYLGRPAVHVTTTGGSSVRSGG